MSATITKRHWFRFSLKGLFVIVTVATCLMVGLRFVYRQVIPPPGFLEDRKEWPGALRNFLSGAGLDALDVDTIRVYRLYDSGGYAEYVWRIDARSENIKAFVDGRGLTRIAVDGNVAQEFAGKIPTAWGIPDLSHDCEVYSTPGFKVTYMEGDMFAVILDKDQRKLFVWYSYIF